MIKIKLLKKEEIVIVWANLSLRGEITSDISPEELERYRDSLPSIIEPLGEKEDPFDWLYVNQKDILTKYVSVLTDVLKILGRDCRWKAPISINDILTWHATGFSSWEAFVDYEIGGGLLAGSGTKEGIIHRAFNMPLKNKKTVISAVLCKLWWNATMSLNVMYPEVLYAGDKIVKVRVPQDKKGLFIGSKGSNIKYMQKEIKRRIIME